MIFQQGNRLLHAQGVPQECLFVNKRWFENSLNTFLSKQSHLVSQVHLERKYVVDIDKNIDITKRTPSTRVALRNDKNVLHLILQSKVNPLVNVMKVEKDPDSTYDMIGGLDQQIKEIKEVCLVYPFTFCI